MTSEAKCVICGEPMPEGETAFYYHGLSGPCPKPPLNHKPFMRPAGPCNKYDVMIQGGAGPDVWERELVVTEVDIVDAARAARWQADDMGGYVTSLQLAC